MATRKPFVNVNGELRELPSGDLVDGVGIITDYGSITGAANAPTTGYNGFASNLQVVASWANMPPIASVTPYIDRVFCIGVGVGGSEWYSDGTRWRPTSGEVILKSYNPNVAITPTVNNTYQDVFSFSVTTGLLSPGDIIKLRYSVGKTNTTNITTTATFFSRIFYASSADQTKLGHEAVRGVSTGGTTAMYGCGEMQFKILSQTDVQCPVAASPNGIGNTQTQSGSAVGGSIRARAGANYLTSFIIGVDMMENVTNPATPTQWNSYIFDSALITYIAG